MKMNWLKKFLVQYLKSFIIELVERAVGMAIIKVEAEIDDSFSVESERATLRYGLEMLRSKIATEIKDRLERL